MRAGASLRLPCTGLTCPAAMWSINGDVLNAATPGRPLSIPRPSRTANRATPTFFLKTPRTDLTRAPVSGIATLQMQISGRVVAKSIGTNIPWADWESSPVRSTDQSSYPSERRTKRHEPRQERAHR